MVQLVFLSYLISILHISTVHTKATYRSLPPVDFNIAIANKTDIIFTLFQNASDEGRTVDESNIENSILNKTAPTVLIIHGWTTDDNSPWYKPLKDVFFDVGPHNIIFVNWNKAGNLSYDVSSANIDPVGGFIADFLIASKIPFEKIQLVGHSLGSQLAGYIGKHILKKTGKKVGRITALDPAGPKFEHPHMVPEKRLNKDDADFVDVIHTDVQFYGFTAPAGHVDFYPNEGKHQPGCPIRDEDANCSHARSTKYYIESFKISAEAQECSVTEELEDFVVTIKKNGRKVIFGQNVDQTARGSFTFNTNSESPFLIRK